jgi:hypothetical protein
MNIRKLTVAGIVMGAFGMQAVVLADEPVVQETPPSSPPVAVEEIRTRQPKENLYPSNQLNLDLFGTYANRDRFGNSVNHGGGGVGLDYFFTPNLGIGADSYVEEWKWPYRVNGSAILRLPLPRPFSKLAIYGLGGGGREFKNVPQYTWHGGGGAEFKLSRNMGIFGDIREVLPDRTRNYTLIRGGLSLGF